MSAPIKRTLFALIIAILMAASSTVFAITLARLTRRHAEAIAAAGDLKSTGFAAGALLDT